jgi:hypothetical protein
MTVILDTGTRKLLDARSFAVAATLGPRNIARDPRVSVTLFDLANPYHTVEIRGVADLLEDPDRTVSYRVTT